MGVGRLKNNAKVCKTFIYTILLLNIISFAIYPKSNSKYKDEKENIVAYTTTLLVHKDEKIDISKQIELSEQDEYKTFIFEDTTSDGIVKRAHVYFEYSIVYNGNLIGTRDIKISTSPIASGATSKIACSIIKPQTSTEKGIIMCSVSDINPGFRLTLTVEKELEDEYGNTTSVILEGKKSYTGEDIQKFVTTQNGKLTTIIKTDDKDICSKFIQFIRDYSSYYTSAFNEANGYTDSPYYTDEILTYLGINESASTCPNFDALTQKEGSKKGLKVQKLDNPSRYSFTIEDNFIGYARTSVDTEKAMYFNTKDGHSFASDTSYDIWNSIFESYLEDMYPNDYNEIIEYVNSYTNNQGILKYIQQYDSLKKPGLEYVKKLGKLIITDTVLDSIYNEVHIGEKVRTTMIVATPPISQNSQDMTTYNAFREGLKIVYPDISTTAINELLGSNPNNYQAALAIYNAVTSLTAADGSKVTQIFDDNGTGNTLLFTITTEVDADTGKIYKYTTVEVLNKSVTANGISFSIKNTATFSGLKKPSASANYFDRILEIVKSLDVYFGIDPPHTSLVEDQYITILRDEDGNILEVIYTYTEDANDDKVEDDSDKPLDEGNQGTKDPDDSSDGETGGTDGSDKDLDVGTGDKDNPSGSTGDNTGDNTSGNVSGGNTGDENNSGDNSNEDTENKDDSKLPSIGDSKDDTGSGDASLEGDKNSGTSNETGEEDLVDTSNGEIEDPEDSNTSEKDLEDEADALPSNASNVDDLGVPSNGGNDSVNDVATNDIVVESVNVNGILPVNTT